MFTFLAAGVFSVNEITLLFLSVAILLGMAKLLGELSRMFKQPAILGEIMAGVILGPTIFGALAPDLFHTLFGSYLIESGEYLNAIGQTITTDGGKTFLDGFTAEDKGYRPIHYALTGIIVISAAFLLLIAGLEVELSTVWKQGKAAISVSVMSMIFPFLVGVATAYMVPQWLGMGEFPFSEHGTLPFILFVGIALAITALPVIAKILMDMNLSKSDFGTIVISSAMVNDLIGWMGFAMILAMVATDTSTGASPSGGLGTTILLTLGFIGFIMTFGRWGFHRILPWIQAHWSWPGGVLGFVMVMAMFGAAFTEWIGIHSIFGAFLVGIAIGDSRHLTEQTRETIHQFISNFFAPLFFAAIGLQVDFLASFDLVAVIVVLVIAIFGKVVGSYLGARLAGMDKKESKAIGFAMTARGAMEIILGQLALQADLISEELFVAIVIMAIVTSLIAGPAIEKILSRKQQARLRDFLSDKQFLNRMDANTPRQAIDKLAAIAAEIIDLPKEDIANAAWAREQIVSSGIGDGLAIPHARIPGIPKPAVVLGRDYEGIDFNAPDGKPAQIIALIVTPLEHPDTQIELLAMICRTFNNPKIRIKALEASTYTEFLAALSLSEQSHEE